LGRLDVGRELLRRLAPGLVLALDAVRGLAVAPFLAEPDFFPPALVVLTFARPALVVLAFVVLALAVVALAAPAFAPRTFAVPAFEPRTFAAPDFAAPAFVVLALAAPALAPPAFAVLDLTVLALTVLALARADVRTLLPAAFAGLVALAVADFADDAVRRGLAAPARFAVAVAGRAEAVGPATDSVFAAEVRALAAVLIALVAVFMDCIAVDIVLADEVARVAAAVILVAAEVTFVAADDTVLAAAADDGFELAEEVRAVPRALLLPLLPVLRTGLAAPLAERAVVLRVDLAAVPRVDDLAPVARAALVVDRPAERLAALVLTDRVLPELAGLRRAGARVVVCTGTDFPPS
jgi:hypothetical protein